MKTSQIDTVKPTEAEREATDIETRISIVRLTIDKYKKVLEKDTSLERRSKALDILKREEEYLESLKDKYPEHFI